MKNLKTAAVIVLLAMNIFSIISSFDYYKNLFDLISSSLRYSSVLIGIQQILFLLSELFELTICLVFLLSSGEVKDKVYKLTRFYFVMFFFLYLPVLISNLVRYFDSATASGLLYFVVMRLAGIFAVIVFIIAKPERPVATVDISDYDMVAYTSTAHRFIHRLVDLFFILPVWLTWAMMLSANGGNETFELQLSLVLAYFSYYFLAEAIFRQTFGKIWTNSCVVSNGISLSTGRVFLRTLSRFIPFDQLSFFWKGNWHDSVSSTSVVYVNTWEKVLQEEANSDYPVQNPA
jgi:hypothetical protein